MRTRTRLTTPPGQDPVTDDRASDAESYSRGLTLPEEPRLPGRFRGTFVVLGVLIVLALGGYGVFRAATAGQHFDPALDPGATNAPGDDPAMVPTDG